MKIWVLGSGTFGARAVRLLSKTNAAKDITLVDPSQKALDGVNISGIKRVCQDGVTYLVHGLRAREEPDWIVPALPVHLAWEWAMHCLNHLERFPLPHEWMTCLPNAMAGACGDVYVSHADFICPPNCNEPDGLCTRTGKPRKEDMFQLLYRKSHPVLPVFVIRSRQLGPGLGGYQPAAMMDLFRNLGSHTGPCAVATACRCHGVVSGGWLR